MYLVWKIERKLKKIFSSSDRRFEVLNSIYQLYLQLKITGQNNSLFYVHANQNYFMF